MGAAKGIFPDQRPVHQVTLGEFWIGKTEITNEQFRRYRSDHPGDAGLPVGSISWDDAKAACEHLGGRLLTEAEWEYAARAGSQTTWSFGDDEKLLDDYAWYGRFSEPHPAGTKKPNAWGLHDMYGNVWEWVADWYGDYTDAAQTDPLGPTTGTKRVVRGGGYMDSAFWLPSAFRFKFVPSGRDKKVGFRCARGPRRQP